MYDSLDNYRGLAYSNFHLFNLDNIGGLEWAFVLGNRTRLSVPIFQEDEIRAKTVKKMKSFHLVLGALVFTGISIILSDVISKIKLNPLILGSSLIIIAVVVAKYKHIKL